MTIFKHKTWILPVRFWVSVLEKGSLKIAFFLLSREDIKKKGMFYPFPFIPLATYPHSCGAIYRIWDCH